MPKIKNRFLILFFFSLLLLCFSSCKMKTEQKSLTSQFETIDALILQNQYSSAIKMLQNIEKKAYDSWSCIGVFKRYTMIGENNLAEKAITKSLKKNPDNLELLAVYANFLIQNERLDEAKKTAEKLCGTKYASLYSEIILKQAVQENNNNKDYYFADSNFYDIFYEAYKTNKNPLWLKNCAVFDLVNGLYDKASLLNPEIYADVDDAFFWAEVLYDAKKYHASLEVLEKSKKLLKDYKNKEKFTATEIKIAALESDVYMALADMEKSEQVRQDLLLDIDNHFVRKEDEKFLPIIVVNSAIWAENQQNSEKCADLLFYAVNNWPDYVPAIILYADYSYKSNLERKEDTEIRALRKAGISSLEMEKYDNRRKIPVSDAFYRIEKALALTDDPYLQIVKLDLKYKTEKQMSEKEKNRDLWYLLEDSYVEDQAYNALLVQYALNYLLRTNQIDDAWRVFYDYVTKNVDFSDKRDFWEQFIEKIHYFELPICEFAGYFAAQQKLLTETIRIYEYCVYESSGLLEEGLISHKVSNYSCMNLADIYYSTGKKEKAMKLYGIVAGRENRNSVRSEIYYRISKIYASQNDIKNALRLAEYSYSLYPQNVKASVFKDKILDFQSEQ